MPVEKGRRARIVDSGVTDSLGGLAGSCIPPEFAADEMKGGSADILSAQASNVSHVCNDLYQLPSGHLDSLFVHTAYRVTSYKVISHELTSCRTVLFSNKHKVLKRSLLV